MALSAHQRCSHGVQWSRAAVIRLRSPVVRHEPLDTAGSIKCRLAEIGFNQSWNRCCIVEVLITTDLIYSRQVGHAGDSVDGLRDVVAAERSVISEDGGRDCSGPVCRV